MIELWKVSRLKLVASKLDDLLDESNQLISIFVKSIGTAKKNKDKTS